MSRIIAILLPVLLLSLAPVSIHAQDMPKMGKRTTPESRKMGLVLNLNNNRPFIAGKTAYFGIQALDDKGQPLKEARIQLNASGGVFVPSESSQFSGRTRESGWAGSSWKLPERSGTYQISWTVQYGGFETRSGNRDIAVEPSPMELKVQLSVDPNPAVYNGIGQVSLFVYEDQHGRQVPVPNAMVEINASNGLFRETMTSTISGQTDNQGRLVVEWRPPHSGDPCELKVVVNKSGFPDEVEKTLRVPLVERLSGPAVLKIGLKDRNGRIMSPCTLPIPVSVMARHSASYSYFEADIGPNCQCELRGLPTGWYDIQASENGKGDAFYWEEQQRVQLQDGRDNWVFFTWKGD